MATVVSHADPKVLPVLNDPMEDISALVNAASVSEDLDAMFGVEEIDDNVVRFTSQASNGSRVMDFALFSNRTPITRTNFLQYVTDGDYNRSIIHRSAPGFVIQGGGFSVPATGAAWPPSNVPTDAPIANEFGVSNTYGTISMAKLGGNPNSATSQWFVSLGDNTANLDNQNGGFTVFGRVTKDTMSSAEDFATPLLFPIYNAGGALTAIPLVAAFDNSAAPVESEYLMFSTVALAPIPAGQAGESTTLTYSITSNTNPAVTASINPTNQLQINYVPDNVGRGSLIIRATDSVGNIVEDELSIEVRRDYSHWRNTTFTPSEAADDTVSGPAVNAGQALTNLELYAHGLTPADRSDDVVVFSNTISGTQEFPTFSFPFFNLLSDVEYVIETSDDLGQSDAWSVVPHVVVNQTRLGNIDSLVIRTASAKPAGPAFYRLRFTLQTDE